MRDPLITKRFDACSSVYLMMQSGTPQYKRRELVECASRAAPALPDADWLRAESRSVSLLRAADAARRIIASSIITTWRIGFLAQCGHPHNRRSLRAGPQVIFISMHTPPPGTTAPLAFITGGTGFIGMNLIEELTRSGWAVVALHRDTSDLTYLRRFPVRLAPGSLLEPAAVEAAMPTGVDAVFHVAADVSFWARNAGRQSEINIHGTRNVVNAALKRRAAKFVHTSSSIVYGFGPGPFDELYPQRGRGSWFNYMNTKSLAEAEVRAGIAQGLDAVILNPSNVIGRFDLHNWSRLFGLALEGKLDWIPGGRSSFSHATQVACAHVAAVSRGRTGENYVLGGVDASYRDLVRMVCAVAGVRPRCRPVPKAILRVAARIFEFGASLGQREPLITPEAAALLSADTTCRSEKAARELGFQTVPLRTMVEDCFGWLVQEGKIRGRPAVTAAS
jgi:dihydroflavonol-4-reductase